MDPETAFFKMRDNERDKKEDDPFDENNKEPQPFYRGCLVYKDGKKVEYFRLLKTDQFICRVYTPSGIAFRDDGRLVKHDVKDYDFWRTNVSNGHRYTPRDSIFKDDALFPELDERIESDIIRYESPNARNMENRLKRMRVR